MKMEKKNFLDLEIINKQLGENLKNKTSELIEIKFFENKKIKDIKCGENHNLILLGKNYFLYLFFI